MLSILEYIFSLSGQARYPFRTKDKANCQARNGVLISLG